MTEHPQDKLPGWGEPIERATRPSWLDAAGEVPHPVREVHPRNTFVPELVEAFRVLGVDVLRAFQAAGPIIYETGWGEGARDAKGNPIGVVGNNFGGVKATPGWAASVLERTGQPARYYRARGNKGTGDTPVVWYRWYPDLAAFLAPWLLSYLPKPGAPSELYRRAGELFWTRPADDLAWFSEQMQRGYRGPNNVDNPGRAHAIRDQDTIARLTRAHWAQAQLGVTSDGKWGPASVAAAESYQRAHELQVTGQPDDDTARQLAHEGEGLGL